MSKKNDRKKHQEYAKFLIQQEKNREQRRQELKERKDAKKAEKMKPKKKKVAPVIGSEVKLAKMLRKQMKTMHISSDARDKKKIDLKDSDSSNSEDEGMQVD